MKSQPSRNLQSNALPVIVLIIAMCCFQLGAALAKQLFRQVGAEGATALRLGLASVMLWVVFRPWRLRRGARERRNILFYGLAMGCMNLCFYLSLARIPLGITVALEFTGPLAVAIASSRRAVDYFWVLLAVLGLLALLPLGIGSKPLDPYGIAFALAAGSFWAMYIVFGRKTGNSQGGQTTAIGTLIGALIIVPFGIAHAGMALLAPSVLYLGCVLALISTAVPYSMEMYALTRLPARTFGILMSGDPAVGALIGLVFLGEALTVVQWSAIASIMIASAGSAATDRAAAQRSVRETASEPGS
jgi:inner membrane transporter RhtA